MSVNFKPICGGNDSYLLQRRCKRVQFNVNVRNSELLTGTFSMLPQGHALVLAN